MDYVSINIDHALVGCGWRRALVASIGPKWVRLFYPAGLQSVQLIRGVYDNARATIIPEYDKGKLSELIARQIKVATLDGRFAGGVTAAECLEFLNKGTAV